MRVVLLALGIIAVAFVAAAYKSDSDKYGWMAQCRVDLMKAKLERSEAVQSDFLRTCMEIEGYRLNLRAASCLEFPNHSSAFCYRGRFF
jgi:hypothetical protein